MIWLRRSGFCSRSAIACSPRHPVGSSSNIWTSPSPSIRRSYHSLRPKVCDRRHNKLWKTELWKTSCGKAATRHRGAIASREKARVRCRATESKEERRLTSPVRIRTPSPRGSSCSRERRWGRSRPPFNPGIEFKQQLQQHRVLAVVQFACSQNCRPRVCDGCHVQVLSCHDSRRVCCRKTAFVSRKALTANNLGGYIRRKGAPVWEMGASIITCVQQSFGLPSSNVICEDGQ